MACILAIRARWLFELLQCVGMCLPIANRRTEVERLYEDSDWGWGVLDLLGILQKIAYIECSWEAISFDVRRQWTWSLSWFSQVVGHGWPCQTQKFLTCLKSEVASLLALVGFNIRMTLPTFNMLALTEVPNDRLISLMYYSWWGMLLRYEFYE